MPTLELHGVRKVYGRTVALDGVDLTVEAGTVLGLLGRNGAGKSTLVSIVAGLRRPDAGQVQVRGSIGLAPQDTGVYMPLSVRDNLRYFGGLAGLRGRALHRRIDDITGELMLDELLTRRASQLSGGERQRVAVCRALITQPTLLLADEPTGNLDRATAEGVGSLLLDLNREFNTLLVCVTHSTELADRFPKHFELRDGKLELQA